MFEFLTSPNYPAAAVGIEHDEVAAVSLDRKNGIYSIRQAAAVPLAAGVLEPSFLEHNLLDADEFARALGEAVTMAGLLGQKRWSAALPGSSARTTILTLDAEPASKKEAEEILDWKAEQAFGAPAAEMRIARRRIAADREGRSRFFVTGVRLEVIDEYETVFERFGWKTGLILPRPVSEANWLVMSAGLGDSLLLSGQADGFTALLLRGGEPSVVRSVTCPANEAGDEIYRLLMFYHDRFGGVLDRILVIGDGLEKAGISEIAGEAFGQPVSLMRPSDVGLSLEGTGMSFATIAAPAGLAALS